jgi:hypothetical protein
MQGIFVYGLIYSFNRQLVMMSRRYCGIVIAILVLSLVLVGCHAKDYREKIGPYEVSFTLRDEIASSTKLNKTIEVGQKTLGGTSYNLNSINMNISGHVGHGWGGLTIYRYNASHAWDSGAAIKAADALGKSNGCTCNSATRLIAGHEGVIVNCSACDNGNEIHQFIYQLNDITEVSGLLYLDWNKVVPFLKSLHVGYRKLVVA